MIPTPDWSCELDDEDALIRVAAMLVEPLSLPAVITLSGELGAGKSVVARAMIRHLGYSGTVRSPTYALSEIYEVAGRTIAHLDLYRLASADELDFIGFDDIVDSADLLLIEWPERGEERLPTADLELELDYRDGGGRHLMARSRHDRHWPLAFDP